MLVGNPKEFAVESEITEVYPRLSQRALGFFVIHIKNRIYGVRKPDATLLANSFDAVDRRIKQRGQHNLPSARIISAKKIAEAFSTARHGDVTENERFLGMSLSQFEQVVYTRDIMWAPDGDEAFDDGSYILQFDEGSEVRLIAFVNQSALAETIATVSEQWLDTNIYYEVLSNWKSAFEEEWRASVRKLHPSAQP
ncbi:Imm42 family immunity protein [Rhizobium jaguaris]|uniref:Imm42 family immunity protein n=1 Tax=Rhizobium jaguaris TaxID=1312183 RepID=UPI0039BEFA9A